MEKEGIKSLVFEARGDDPWRAIQESERGGRIVFELKEDLGEYLNACGGKIASRMRIDPKAGLGLDWEARSPNPLGMFFGRKPVIRAVLRSGPGFVTEEEVEESRDLAR